MSAPHGKSMKITIDGKSGSGKSTICKELARRLAEDFNLLVTRHSAGDFARQLAKERGMTILELLKIADTDSAIDKEIDARTKKFGEEHDNFIMDGRVTGLFVPDAIRIFLDVDLDVAAKRIYEAKRKDEHNPTLQETKEKIVRRYDLEMSRYEQYYAFDFTDPKHYDLVIDTSHLTIEEILDRIIAFIKEKEHLSCA